MSIINILRRIMEDKAAIRDYFRQSKLFEAIKDHIWHNGHSEYCALISESPLDRNGDKMLVAIHRGHGPAVYFRDAHCYMTQYRDTPKGTEAYEVDFFNLKIEVTWRSNSDDYEISHSYDIQVPIDLEDNFTRGKFDTWIEEKRMALKAKQAETEIPLLKKLMKKYPEVLL